MRTDWHCDITVQELHWRLAQFMEERYAADYISVAYLNHIAAAYHQTKQFRVNGAHFMTWGYFTPEQEMRLINADKTLYAPENILPGPGKALWILSCTLRAHELLKARELIPLAVENHKARVMLVTHGNTCVKIINFGRFDSKKDPHIQ